ncbi:MAG: hypothetical protein KA153_06970, partial [Hyphomonadaceae bacterium]|nr:hypothetical protein [Hyphomonadaceae bacterium]
LCHLGHQNDGAQKTEENQEKENAFVHVSQLQSLGAFALLLTQMPELPHLDAAADRKNSAGGAGVDPERKS